jgi:hypothetical protein
MHDREGKNASFFERFRTLLKGYSIEEWESYGPEDSDVIFSYVSTFTTGARDHILLSRLQIYKHHMVRPQNGK